MHEQHADQHNEHKQQEQRHGPDQNRDQAALRFWRRAWRRLRRRGGFERLRGRRRADSLLETARELARALKALRRLFGQRFGDHGLQGGRRVRREPV